MANDAIGITEFALMHLLDILHWVTRREHSE
jgi:hypothetical protein